MSFSINSVFFALAVSLSGSAFAFPPMPGERHDVGGYKLHIHCKGEGAPTVIIDVGLGDDSTDWLPVQVAAASTSKVCVFDRPGYGWSDFGPRPRDSSRIVSELEVLLKNADIPPPYVMVGHSFGGYNVRLFAANNPDDIAGMILVDSSHERQHEQLEIKLPQNPGRGSNVLILQKSSEIDYHADKHVMLRERAYRASVAEITAMHQSATQVQQNAVIPSIPLIVISRGRSDWMGNEAAAQREKIWTRLQQDLTRLSPLSRHIFAHKSGHAIPQQQPEIIVDAISQVIELARIRETSAVQ
ncbi:hydrolase [Methylophaga lonarensis MPL]|uniref:Hydrolase n=1 Tax=Methylophaga lonarensis MPL TaxID=1286106 RepID=M7PHG3_9GAMM|nr:alpha/beta hydrolase [Methylophaga lonarensis]EMR13315.1 hydrolase [Methylophaga lonarensis MPL]